MVDDGRVEQSKDDHDRKKSRNRGRVDHVQVCVRSDAFVAVSLWRTCVIGCVAPGNLSIFAVIATQHPELSFTSQSSNIYFCLNLSVALKMHPLIESQSKTARARKSI